MYFERSEYVSIYLAFCLLMFTSGMSQSKQEVSSKKIIVEAKMALLSLKKDNGIVKGFKRADDWAAKTKKLPNFSKD